MGGATPRQVVLGCIRKQVEQARENEPVAAFLDGFCLCSWFSSCPDFTQGWAVIQTWKSDKSFPPPKLVLVSVFSQQRKANKRTLNTRQHRTQPFFILMAKNWHNHLQTWASWEYTVPFKTQGVGKTVGWAWSGQT